MNRNRYPFLAGGPTKPAPSAGQPNSNRAFTLTELIVVLAMLAVLGGLLLPVLAATQDRSNRAVCQYHLRQIAVAMTQYAADHNDYVVSAAHSLFSIELNVPLASTASRIGLTTNSGGSCIWTCPNRPTLPRPMPSGNAWLIGYQYYGGITNWVNNLGTFPSRSPVKLSQAKPYWMLAADVIAQPDGVNWNQAGESGVQSGWDNLPAHHTADTMVPQGGNEVFCDGSVQWIDIHKMYAFHTGVDPFGDLHVRYLYFYQDLTGDPLWLARLRFLMNAGVLSPGSRF